MAAPIRHVCRACPNLPLLFMRSETVSVKSEFTGLSRCRSSVQGCCSVKKLPSNGVNPGATRDNLLGQPPMWCPLMEKYCSLTLVCWSCQTPSPKEKQKTMFFCEHCDSIQPVIDEVNHFERLEFKTSFDVDIDKLTRKYRELQSILHPDKYGTKTLEEQNYSSQQSAAINKAYKTLFRPLSRGLYLLDLMGRSINEHDQNVDMAFLAEIMEVNEEIADAKTKPELLKIDDKNKTKLDQLVHDLSKAFSKNDLDTARELLRKMKYYVNIEMKIKEKLMPTAS